MDAVITYVNMNDPVWIEQYKSQFNDTPNISRYKELGTLKLQVQCIRKYMSWIDNIYIVVSTHSQIEPIENTTIITHDMIIPKTYLPTFNSCTIEMFLNRIPGLSDYFIYFNDDIFPIDYVKEDEFFDKQLNRPILSFKYVAEPPVNIFRYQCKNSANLARLLSNIPLTSDFIKPDHICLIHSKKVYDDIWSRAEKTLLSSITNKRESKNLNQYLFVDYLYYSKQCTLKRLNYVYLPYSSYTSEEIKNIIVSQRYSLICIQDNIQNDNYNIQLISGLTEILNK